MIVSELIKKLQDMPQDAQVAGAYDGALRTEVECVWLARSGVVGLANDGETLYYLEDRPDGAPDEDEDRYWEIKNR